MIDLKHCEGCRDDFYNGKNNLNVKQCWMRAEAKLEPRALIHINQMPPYRNLKFKLTPTCYSRPQYAVVKRESIGEDGYWSR